MSRPNYSGLTLRGHVLARFANFLFLIAEPFDRMAYWIHREHVR